jgi:YHS domain-containing protein
MFRALAELILFTIAVSVIRSVISSLQRAFFGSRSRPIVRGSAAGGPSAGDRPTMLKQDPVCGTYVAIDSSLKRIVHGQVLHFCSAECRDKYQAIHG